MKLNGLLYRLFRAPKTDSQLIPGDSPECVRVQLGPGKRCYLDSWYNVDANMFTAKCDVWADLRNKLPFKDNSVDALYSHHVIEHLPDLPFHFKDAFRCLKPGAVYRVGGPNGDNAIRKFVEKDLDWFSDFPENRRSIGGRFENFVFCKQEHLTILTFSYLEELLSNAGFTNIKTCLPIKETFYPEYFSACLGNEFESDFAFPHTIILEAQKNSG